MAKRTDFANLPSLAATRATVSEFRDSSGRCWCLTIHLHRGGEPCASSCPPVAGQPTCRTVEVRVYYRGPLGDSTATLTQIFVR